MRMTVLGRGQIFQPVLLANTYNNDTMITLQNRVDITEGGRGRERERGGGGGTGTERERERGGEEGGEDLASSNARG